MLVGAVYSCEILLIFIFILGYADIGSKLQKHGPRMVIFGHWHICGLWPFGQCSGRSIHPKALLMLLVYHPWIEQRPRRRIMLDLWHWQMLFETHCLSCGSFEGFVTAFVARRQKHPTRRGLRFHSISSYVHFRRACGPAFNGDIFVACGRSCWAKFFTSSIPRASNRQRGWSWCEGILDFMTLNIHLYDNGECESCWYAYWHLPFWETICQSRQRFYCLESYHYTDYAYISLHANLLELQVHLLVYNESAKI